MRRYGFLMLLLSSTMSS